MNNELTEILDEIFEDEIYDMCDVLPQETICKKVAYAASQISRKARTVTFVIDGNIFKIVNCIGGFVSCSNADGTGVSRTLHKPFPNDADHDTKERFTNLISMMNEAWYLCNNDIVC